MKIVFFGTQTQSVLGTSSAIKDLTRFEAQRRSASDLLLPPVDRTHMLVPESQIPCKGE